MISITLKYMLLGFSVHLEQAGIPNFEKLSYKQRRSKVEQLRKAKLLQLQRAANSNLYHQTKKNFRKTGDYVHLTYSERKDFISELAHCISEWGFARLFAECVDKIYFDPTRREQLQTIDEQCFEQVVSRFEHYLQLISAGEPKTSCGMLIHDNNETVAKKLTDLMKQFHQKGTMWTKVKNIIETPLFVDSQLTSMVQLADLCGYALRRYLENSEKELFNLVLKRADRKDNILVGVRHYTRKGCKCQICSQHQEADTKYSPRAKA